MTNWLASLEQERPNHPIQLEHAARMERDAWERTKPQRAWREELRQELRKQGQNV